MTKTSNKQRGIRFRVDLEERLEALAELEDLPFSLVDLRCDWHDADPVAALRRLWAAYEPQMEAYRTRAINPETAPSYGVPGDK